MNTQIFFAFISLIFIVVALIFFQHIGLLRLLEQSING